jgi:colanic acid/amylovoran biosynthesis glycosyltransferase
MSRPQRVLYVVSLFPCWSETFIVREIEQLVAAGVDVRILSLKPPCEKLVHPRAEALMTRVRHAGSGAGKVLRHALAHPVAVGAAMLEAVVAFWRQPTVLAKTLVSLLRAIGELDDLRAFSPQWIHAHWATYPSTAAMLLARVLGVRFSFTAHAHDIYVESQLLPQKLSRAAFTATISRFNVGWLEPWVRRAGRADVRVVHCGIDPDEIAYQPDGRDPATMLAVGRLDPIKGYDVLLDACARLAARGVAFRLSIAGDGPERERLLARRAELGLDEHVAFEGAQPQTWVRAALARATLFVLPSRVAPDGNRDGIPVALMEAMAAGTPVATTEVSGIPELVRDGVEGRVVPPGDAAALAEALEMLLEDRVARGRMAEAARAKVEREFDVRVEAARLLEGFKVTTHA